MKATTVTPVVEPDVTLTMTMQEARNLRLAIGPLGQVSLRRLLADSDDKRIDELCVTTYDTYQTLGAVTKGDE